MAQALTYLYQIYQGFITMVFTDFDIGGGVTIGWITISIMVFGILINSILNIPKGIRINGRSNNSRG